jgi:hypothetical protein
MASGSLGAGMRAGLKSQAHLWVETQVSHGKRWIYQ